MQYADQLHKAIKLVGERDLVKDVKIIWLQQSGEDTIEVNFMEELTGEEENFQELVDSGDYQSLYDLFIAIAEALPRKVWLQFSDGKKLEIFDQDQG